MDYNGRDIRFNFILLIMKINFFFVSSRQDIIVENAILKKENEILKRKKRGRIKFRFFDRLFYTVICKSAKKQMTV